MHILLRARSTLKCLLTHGSGVQRQPRYFDDRSILVQGVPDVVFRYFLGNIQHVDRKRLCWSARYGNLNSKRNNFLLLIAQVLGPIISETDLNLIKSS